MNQLATIIYERYRFPAVVFGARLRFRLTLRVRRPLLAE